MNLLNMDSESSGFDLELDGFSDEYTDSCKECGSELETYEHAGRCLNCGSEIELDEFENNLDELEAEEEIRRGGSGFRRRSSSGVGSSHRVLPRVGNRRPRPRSVRPTGALRPNLIGRHKPHKPHGPHKPPIIVRPGRRRRLVIREPAAPCLCPAHGTEFVRWVQSSLNQILGLRLPVNGVMNRSTRDAVRDFQKQQGLPIDGIAGPETEKALIDAKARQLNPRLGQNPSRTMNRR